MATELKGGSTIAGHTIIHQGNTDIIRYIHRSDVAPTNIDVLWLDTSITPNVLKYNDGVTWIALNSYA